MEARLLFQELAQTFGARGSLVFGLDETIERCWGRRIAARGLYLDAARSSKAVTNQTSGLRWLGMHLLARVPWADKIWALPFLTVLAPSARYYQQRGRQPQKLTNPARQAIGQGKRSAPGRALIFVADSSHEVLELLAWCQRPPATLITPLRMAAWTAGRTDTWIGRFYRRIKAGRGAPKAVRATARKLACVIYHLLKYPE